MDHCATQIIMHSTSYEHHRSPWKQTHRHHGSSWNTYYHGNRHLWSSRTDHHQNRHDEWSWEQQILSYMEHCRPSSPRAYWATKGRWPNPSISLWLHKHLTCVLWSSDSWWTHFSWVWSYGLGNDHRAISLIQTSHCLQCYPLWRMVTLLMSAMETSTTCTTLL